MVKRGSIEISFSMIFSIIIIIAIVGVAIFAILKFLEIGKATELGLFSRSFEEAVDGAWSSSITNRTNTFYLPEGIELVCFGNLRGSTKNEDYSKAYNEFKRYSNSLEQENSNRFIYPTDKAGEFAFEKVAKIDLSEMKSEFECFKVKNGEIKIRLVKEQNDGLVKVMRE